MSKMPADSAYALLWVLLWTASSPEYPMRYSVLYLLKSTLKIGNVRILVLIKRKLNSSVR